MEEDSDFVARVMYAAYRFSVTYAQSIKTDLGSSLLEHMPPHFSVIERQGESIRFRKPVILDDIPSRSITRESFVPDVEPEDWAQYGRYATADDDSYIGYVIWGALTGDKKPYALIKCNKHPAGLFYCDLNDEAVPVELISISEISPYCEAGYNLLDESSVEVRH